MSCDTGTCRFSEGFKSNSCRVYFIRRVFLLLIFAFAFMLGHVLLVTFNEDFKNFLNKNYWIAFIGLTIYICICLLLSCSAIARNGFPWNFILFIVLIESLSLMLMVVAALTDPKQILWTLVFQTIVLLMFLTLILLVPADITKWIHCVLLLFAIIGILTAMFCVIILTTNLPRSDFIYPSLAVIILSLLILLNLNILFNGVIFELYPNDCVLGAILVFSDVVIFFMCCLKLVGFDTDA